MKFHNILLVAALLVTLTALMVSCGKKVDDDSQSKLSEKEQISKMLNDTMYRLRHGDKSALYDLEFEYQRYETTYDKYLGIGRIGWAEADTLERIEVDSIEFFRPESAYVWVRVHFLGPSGDSSYRDDRLTIYKDQGNWIKPTVSTYRRQQEYENMIQAADSVAEAEAEEFGS